MAKASLTGAVRAAWWACLVVATIGALMLAGRALAVFDQVSETGTPGYLSLRSSPGEPYWENFQPGDHAVWDIQTHLDDATRGHLSLEIHAEGRIVDHGLTITMRGCSTPFTDEGCPGSESVVIAHTALKTIAQPTSAEVFTLPDIHIDHPHHYRIELTRPNTPDTGPAEARIGVGFHAHAPHDPSARAHPQGTLPATGVDLAGIALLTCGLVGAGALAAVRRRTRNATGAVT